MLDFSRKIEFKAAVVLGVGLILFSLILVSLPAGSQVSAPSQLQPSGAQQPQSQAPATNLNVLPQAQAAFKTYYTAAKAVIMKPSSDYDPKQNPNYPKTWQAQLVWDNFMVKPGNILPDPPKTQYTTCVFHLKRAVSNAEMGYNLEKGNPNSMASQTEGEGLIHDAQQELQANQTLCDQAGSAVKKPLVGSVESNAPVSGNGTPQSPLISGVDTSAPAPPPDGGLAKDGSPTDANLPGYIDWTPYLAPLQDYLANEWRPDPSWPQDYGTKLTIKLTPGNPPELVASSGPHVNVMKPTLSKAPVTPFPPGSRLRSIEIAPEFRVGQPFRSKRTRRTYYELNGVFKTFSQ